MISLESTDDLERQIDSIFGDIAELAPAAAAVVYACRGFEVFPLKPNKAPYTAHGMKDASSDPGVAGQRWALYPDALIGCRVPSEVVILDVDPRHDGDRTIAELEAVHGRLPATRMHLSGRGDGGLHLWFRRPAGDRKLRGLEGVDVLHYGHRYTILPPSPHPETGRAYEWAEGSGPTAPLAEMPAWLVDVLADDKPAPNPARTVLDRPALLDGLSPIDEFNARHEPTDLLAEAGWVEVGRDRWRHPSATAAHSATVKDGRLYVYSPTPGLPVTEAGDPQGLSAFDLFCHLRHGGDVRAAVAALRPAQTVVGYVVPSTGEIAPETPAGRPELPEEFWTARPVHDHIRRAMHSRGRSAPAGIMVALTRVAAGTPHVIKIPPVVGAPSGLSFFAGILGPPGTGKSSAADIASKLIALDDHVRDHMPIGTGEGLIDVLFSQVDGLDGKGKEWRQAFHNALFWVDEGQMATAIAARSGATLLPVLRTVWSDGTLGQSNASGGRDRRVPAGHYVYGIGVAFQESKLGAFFDDASGGTPQRFAWASSTDPTIPAPGDRPAWPGPLDWQPPDVDARRCLELVDGMYLLDVAGQVRAEIEAADYARATGRIHADEFSAHGDLLRLKMSALLAVLDRRLNVTVEDWQLAGMLKRYSDQSGSAALRTIRDEAKRAEADTSARLARRKVQEVSAVETHRTFEAAKRIAAKVHASNAVTVIELRRQLPRWRTEFGDGLDFAIEAGWVVESSEPGQGTPKRVLRPGPTRPA